MNGGSGKNAYVAGYRVGGKTGTSQKLDSENAEARIASFVGIAPADDPKIAVLIALDEPHSFTTSGGALAAPVAAQVIEDTLQYYGVQRQYTRRNSSAWRRRCRARWAARWRPPQPSCRTAVLPPRWWAGAAWW